MQKILYLLTPFLHCDNELPRTNQGVFESRDDPHIQKCIRSLYPEHGTASYCSRNKYHETKCQTVPMNVPYVTNTNKPSFGVDTIKKNLYKLIKLKINNKVECKSNTESSRIKFIKDFDVNSFDLLEFHKFLQEIAHCSEDTSYKKGEDEKLDILRDYLATTSTILATHFIQDRIKEYNNDEDSNKKKDMDNKLATFIYDAVEQFPEEMGTVFDTVNTYKADLKQCLFDMYSQCNDKNQYEVFTFLVIFLLGVIGYRVVISDSAGTRKTTKFSGF